MISPILLWLGDISCLRCEITDDIVRFRAHLEGLRGRILVEIITLNGGTCLECRQPGLQIPSLIFRKRVARADREKEEDAVREYLRHSPKGIKIRIRAAA